MRPAAPLWAHLAQVDDQVHVARRVAEGSQNDGRLGAVLRAVVNQMR